MSQRASIAEVHGRFIECRESERSLSLQHQMRPMPPRRSLLDLPVALPRARDLVLVVLGQRLAHPTDELQALPDPITPRPLAPGPSWIHPFGFALVDGGLAPGEAVD